MRVGDLTRPKPVTATVDLGDGDAITLTFDRNKVTPAWTQLASERDEQSDALSVPKALADVLLEWDVVNDDGTPFPPTVTNIAVLSYPAQKALLQQMLRAAVPSDAEGKDSPAPPPMLSSGSVAQVPTFPNGQVTLPSPAPSESPFPT